MGLLDFNLDNLDDPKKMGLLMAAAGLFQGQQGKANFGADLSRGLLGGVQGYASAQKAERENRANDLQQLSGAYNLLKQQEFGRMMASKQNGQPFSPNPMLPQMESRIGQLTGLSNLSSKLGPQSAPQAAPQASQAAPSPMPAAQASQYSPAVNPEWQAKGPMPQAQPQASQQDGNGLGGPAGGIPMEWWLAHDPSGGSYLKQLAEDNKPIVMRQGDLVGRGKDGNYTSLYQQPSMDKGVLPQRDNRGQVTGASAIPGYAPAVAEIKSAESAGSAYGAMPYHAPTPVQTPGAPTLMTVPQQIKAATGQEPPNPMVTPEVQGQRNAGQLSILRAELARTLDPKDRAAINTEIAALQGAQQRGNPFSSQKPGLALQDQGAAAAQKTLGGEIGTQAADVFKTGAASVQAKRSLEEMSSMAKSYQPGIFQPMKAKLAQYASGFGLPEDTVNKILSTNAGDIQGLTSAAIAMAGKLTRQTDAQPSQLQFLKTLESMPSAERSAQGFAKIMEYLNNMHDYNIEKMIAQQQWLDDPKHNGEPGGFEAAWAQKAKTLPLIWNQQHQASNDPLVVTDPNGGVHRFPSAIAAKAFKKAIGQ